MTSSKPDPDAEPETIPDTIPAPKDVAVEGPAPHVEPDPAPRVQPDRLGEPPHVDGPVPSRKIVTRPSSPRAIRLDDLRKALEDLRERHDEIFPPPSKEGGEK